jgi:uracil-DNA glycosylase family 4
MLDFNIIQPDREDAAEVLKLLSVNCTNCRLSLLHPTNKGLVWRGSLEAKIAIIGEAPGDKETEQGSPMVGPSGREFERWARLLEIDTKTDVLITNVVQCQPAKTDNPEGGKAQSAPDKDEIELCFESRALRLLKAMPNLEVVMTLGWVAAEALLETEIGSKSHQAQWFASQKLPGKAIFCLFHPAYLLRQPSQEKKGLLEEGLKAFKRDYLDPKTSKILGILKENEERNGTR